MVHTTHTNSEHCRQALGGLSGLRSCWVHSGWALGGSWSSSWGARGSWKGRKLQMLIFPKMIIWKQLEPPKAPLSHPILEAKLLWALSWTMAHLALGNGSAAWILVQSRTSGNTSCNRFKLGCMQLKQFFCSLVQFSSDQFFSGCITWTFKHYTHVCYMISIIYITKACPFVGIAMLPILNYRKTKTNNFWRMERLQ